MKVKELIETLSQMDPELEVMKSSWHSGIEDDDEDWEDYDDIDMVQSSTDYQYDELAFNRKAIPIVLL